MSVSLLFDRVSVFDVCLKSRSALHNRREQSSFTIESVACVCSRRSRCGRVAVGVFGFENLINDEEVSRGADDAQDRVSAALSLKFESEFQPQ